MAAGACAGAESALHQSQNMCRTESVAHLQRLLHGGRDSGSALRRRRALHIHVPQVPQEGVGLKVRQQQHAAAL